jgi:hypothetical protein
MNQAANAKEMAERDEGSYVRSKIFDIVEVAASIFRTSVMFFVKGQNKHSFHQYHS